MKRIEHGPVRAWAGGTMALWGGMVALAAVCGCGPATSGAGKKTTPPSTAAATTGAASSTPSDPGKPAPAATASRSAPEFSLPTLDGDDVALSDYLGKKVILIDIWATTCHPCVEEMPELVKLYNERKDKGFIVLAISVDGPDTMSQVTQVVRDKKMSFPILIDDDTEVMDRYNPKRELPYTALIDRKGQIVLERVSYTPGDAASMQSLVEAIDKALSE